MSNVMLVKEMRKSTTIQGTSLFILSGTTQQRKKLDVPNTNFHKFS